MHARQDFPRGLKDAVLRDRLGTRHEHPLGVLAVEELAQVPQGLAPADVSERLGARVLKLHGNVGQAVDERRHRPRIADLPQRLRRLAAEARVRIAQPLDERLDRLGHADAPERPRGLLAHLGVGVVEVADDLGDLAEGGGTVQVPQFPHQGDAAARLADHLERPLARLLHLGHRTGQALRQGGHGPAVADLPQRQRALGPDRRVRVSQTLDEHLHGIHRADAPERPRRLFADLRVRVAQAALDVGDGQVARDAVDRAKRPDGLGGTGGARDRAHAHERAENARRKQPRNHVAHGLLAALANLQQHQHAHDRPHF